MSRGKKLKRGSISIVLLCDHGTHCSHGIATRQCFFGPCRNKDAGQELPSLACTFPAFSLAGSGRPLRNTTKIPQGGRHETARPQLFCGADGRLRQSVERKFYDRCNFTPEHPTIVEIGITLMNTAVVRDEVAEDKVA